MDAKILAAIKDAVTTAAAHFASQGRDVPPAILAGKWGEDGKLRIGVIPIPKEIPYDKSEGKEFVAVMMEALWQRCELACIAHVSEAWVKEVPNVDGKPVDPAALSAKLEGDPDAEECLVVILHTAEGKALLSLKKDRVSKTFGEGEWVCESGETSFAGRFADIGGSRGKTLH